MDTNDAKIDNEIKRYRSNIDEITQLAIENQMEAKFEQYDAIKKDFQQFFG